MPGGDVPSRPRFPSTRDMRISRRDTSAFRLRVVQKGRTETKGIKDMTTTPVGEPAAVSGAGRAGRARWAAWGVAAGALGFVAHLATDPQGSLSVAERQAGASALELIDRVDYHVGAVAGFLAVACLLVVAAGWRRMAERWGDGLAARVPFTAFVAAAGAMTIGYGFKGALAVYLPGGINKGEYPREALYTLFMVNDLAPFFAWLGVIVAAGAVAVLALRQRVLPRWVGAVSVLAVLPPLGFLFITGLTGFSGITGPIWLAVVSAGIWLRGER